MAALFLNPSKYVYTLSRNKAIVDRVVGFLERQAEGYALVGYLGGAHPYNGTREAFEENGYELIYTSETTLEDMIEHHDNHVKNFLSNTIPVR